MSILAKKKETHEEYTLEVQEILLSYLISDPNAYSLSQTIIKPDYFDNTLRKAVRFIQDYGDKHHSLPMVEQIEAASGKRIEKLSEVSSQHLNWFLDTIEKFCRYKALETIIYEGIELLTEGRGAEIEQRVKDAQTISLVKDLGTDYFKDPKTRIEKMNERFEFISSGWRDVDTAIRMEPGTLHIACAPSGHGKSLLLQNLSLNWAQLGMDVIYITLELSEDLVANRLDAMVSGTPTKFIYDNINEVASAIKLRGFHSKGSLTIKKLPEVGTTCNTIRAFLKEYEIKTGKKPTGIALDYLDLLSSNDRRVDSNNIFLKDSAVSLELRNIASDYSISIFTASQFNRSAIDESEFTAAHIAGGISKVSNADSVMGIMASPAYKAKGRFDLQFLKTRTTDSVGKTVTLKYHPATMLLTDADDSTDMALKTEDNLKETIKNITEDNVASVAIPQSMKQSSGNDIKALMNKIRKQKDQ